MQLNKRTGALAAAIVCGATSLTLGEGNTADVNAQMEALKAQLDRANAQMQTMRAEIGQIRSASGENWLNERRAEEVKALVREVLSDADTRASLQEGGMTAGYNKNFFLASEDGTFLLKVGGRIQVRYIANFREDDTGANPDEEETGFQIRRVKPFFSGHIGSPKFDYHIVLAADRNSTTVGLEEAVIGYELMDDLRLYGGRTKAPFLREELTSSGRQLAVERSLVNEIFTTGFTEGIGATYKADMWRVNAMLNDGQNAGEISQSNAPYFPSSVPNAGGRDFNNDQTDIAFTARFDLKLAGDWKQADDFSAWSGEEFAAFLGAAIHVERGERGNDQNEVDIDPGPGVTLVDVADNDDFLMWTIDGSFEVAGFNMYGAFIGRHDDDEDTNSNFTEDNRDAYGAVVQAGYFVIPDKLEPFARLEWFDLDEVNDPDENILATVGANYYFIKHNAKFTLDLVYVADDALFANSTGLGLIADAADADSEDENGQVAVRAQFQLQF